LSSYLFEYAFDGSMWAMEIEASDEAEARARIAAVGVATYQGEIALRADAVRGAHLPLAPEVEP
jgi:hypothetical protein